MKGRGPAVEIHDEEDEESRLPGEAADHAGDLRAGKTERAVDGGAADGVAALWRRVYCTGFSVGAIDGIGESVLYWVCCLLSLLVLLELVVVVLVVMM